MSRDKEKADQQRLGQSTNLAISSRKRKDNPSDGVSILQPISTGFSSTTPPKEVDSIKEKIDTEHEFILYLCVVYHSDIKNNKAFIACFKEFLKKLDKGQCKKLKKLYEALFPENARENIRQFNSKDIRTLKVMKNKTLDLSIQHFSFVITKISIMFLRHCNNRIKKNMEYNYFEISNEVLAEVVRLFDVDESAISQSKKLLINDFDFSQISLSQQDSSRIMIHVESTDNITVQKYDKNILSKIKADMDEGQDGFVISPDPGSNGVAVKIKYQYIESEVYDLEVSDESTASGPAFKFIAYIKRIREGTTAISIDILSSSSLISNFGLFLNLCANTRKENVASYFFPKGKEKYIKNGNRENQGIILILPPKIVEKFKPDYMAATIELFRFFMTFYRKALKPKNRGYFIFNKENKKDDCNEQAKITTPAVKKLLKLDSDKKFEAENQSQSAPVSSIDKKSSSINPTVATALSPFKLLSKSTVQASSRKSGYPLSSPIKFFSNNSNNNDFPAFLKPDEILKLSPNSASFTPGFFYINKDDKDELPSVFPDLPVQDTDNNKDRLFYNKDESEPEFNFSR